MKKKALALALAIVLCLSLLPSTALAAGDFTIENGVFTKYNGSGGAVTIPNGVTEIGYKAFSDCIGLTSVTIPNGVTKIGNVAFARCTALTSVNIPDSVTEIDAGAFFICPSLTSVTIPAGVTRIGYHAFLGCDSLTSVTIPDSVTEIGEGILANCSGLTSVTIPDSVTEIKWGAFEGCTGLSDVYYGGNEAQWNAIDIAKKNDYLTNAAIHYNSGSTGTENPPAPANTAYASTQNVGVDGKTVEFQCYALKNENGDKTNYVKLRDVAIQLNGSAAQFNVGWDAGTITASSGQSYTGKPEMGTPFSGDRAYEVSTSKLMVNGKIVDVEAILLKDDSGAGYTYFKLRDLGRALNFNVSWVSGTGIIISTDEPYSDAN